MESSLKNTDLVWVDQPQKLEEVANELAKHKIIAVDTESNSLYAYQEQVCMIQFSTSEKDYLVDALILKDLTPLAAIFYSDRILKVFHAAEYDLICLFRDYGFRFRFLFDTMTAARILGRKKVGLGSLLDEYFHLKMNKRYQRANWGRRPLPDEMLDYARLDSHYLIPLQEKLREELQSTGRWDLALEDFRRLTQNIEDTTESSEDDFWKLRGAHDLSPEQAAVLKSVFQLRESLAKAQDKPPFKIFSNQVVVEVAETCPEDPQSLSKVTCLSERLKKSFGRQILRVVKESKNAPPVFPEPRERADNGVLQRMDVLREWRKDTAQGLGVPSDVILPRDVLNRIARGDPENAQSLKKLMKDVPYRYHRFGGAMLQLLKKGTKHG